jgi:hypothetical protein
MHHWQYDKSNDDLTVAASVLGRALWPTLRPVLYAISSILYSQFGFFC